MKLPHMRYAELTDRLYRAYRKDSQGLNPNDHGDPHTEYKLAERLRLVTEEKNFAALMVHLQDDLAGKLSEAEFPAFVDYAIFLRVHMGEEATCDPRDSTQLSASPLNLGPIATGHKV